MFAKETDRVERAAVDAVLEAERSLGRQPTEMTRNHKGYDIESKCSDGSLLFIEVKGRIEGAQTVTVSTSEIGVGRNMADHFILAIAEVPVEGQPSLRYLRHPFDGMGEPHFAEVSINFKWAELWDAASAPS